MLIRALLALAFFATAICGVKGAPRPPETATVPSGAAALPGSAGIPIGAIAPDATAIDPARDPIAWDAGCTDGGAK
jgi:hypothetical protein